MVSTHCAVAHGRVHSVHGEKLRHELVSLQGLATSKWHLRLLVARSIIRVSVCVIDTVLLIAMRLLLVTESSRASPIAYQSTLASQFLGKLRR